MSLPPDLKDYHAPNERAMFWLELVVWLIAGPLIVAIVAITVLGLT